MSDILNFAGDVIYTDSNINNISNNGNIGNNGNTDNIGSTNNNGITNNNSNNSNTNNNGSSVNETRQIQNNGNGNESGEGSGEGSGGGGGSEIVIKREETDSLGYSDTGYLVVAVFAARGAIPVRDALVTVFLDREGSTSPYAVLNTNESGRTIKIGLPAPPRQLSLTPSKTDANTEVSSPFALYNITIEKEQYYPLTDVGVQIFSGITAIQSVNMLPVSEERPITGYEGDSVNNPIIVDATRENNL